MNKKRTAKRILIIFAALAAVLVLIFCTVFLLAKQKKIFINKWFVDEKKYTVSVDVSSYQADIDMNELKKQNIRFIYIKATEGSGSQDARFTENWENAKEAGLLSGAYHFFSYDSPGKTQAENYISTYEKYLKGEFDEYKKWISSLYTPLSCNYKDEWYIWQYLNRGELRGYTGGEKYIDLNILSRDKSLEDLTVKAKVN